MSQPQLWVMPYGGTTAWTWGETRAVNFWLAFSQAILAVGIPYTASRTADWQYFDGLLLLFLACQRVWMLLASLLPPIRHG